MRKKILIIGNGAKENALAQKLAEKHDIFITPTSDSLKEFATCLDIRENNVEITSKSEEGNVKEDVIISKEGNDLVIGFNSKYLMDALKVIDDEEITILFNSSVSPCLIKPISGNDYEYLVLPVRITNN